ncbi:MAG: WD40/YVTN/BNR-like repeat-containing protein [Bacteroidia bacterium]
MKSIALFCLSLLTTALTAQNWIPLNSGVTQKLNDVFFTSRDTGYVVGNDSVLLRTTNRGNTWTRLNDVDNYSPGNLNGIWMFSNGTGYIAPVYQSGVPQTANSGTSWNTNLNSVNPCFPDGLFFASPNNGFLFGQGCFGGAFISHWDGVNWSGGSLLDYTYLGNGNYIQIRGVAYNPSTNTAVAVGDRGKIFRSTDNFQTWDTIVMNDSADFTAIDYAGNNRFYISSKAQFASAYLSTDDGQSFSIDQTFQFTFFYPEFYDIDMLDNGFGVIGGYAQTGGTGFLQIRNTTGWGFQYEGVPQIISAVYVVDSTLAFAVGDSGAIYRYDHPVGMGEISQATQTLALFPSVVEGNEAVTLDLPEGEIFQVEILDARGRVCMRYANCAGAYKMDLEKFSPQAGVYFVQAIGERTRACGKLVVR